MTIKVLNFIEILLFLKISWLVQELDFPHAQKSNLATQTSSPHNI